MLSLFVQFSVILPLFKHGGTFILKVLVSGPRVEEASDQRSSNSSSGNLAGISGPRRPQCHQRGLQELRQNHPECQRSWTLRFRGRTGETKIPKTLNSIYAILNTFCFNDTKLAWTLILCF